MRVQVPTEHVFAHTALAGDEHFCVTASNALGGDSDPIDA